MTIHPISIALQEKALQLDDILCKTYGAPFPYFSTKDPMSELVSSMLSHRTKNRMTGQAYRQLRERFPTWKDVRDAPTAAVEAAIQPVTYPDVKAVRIQQAIRLIQERNEGQLSLDFLKTMTPAAARVWLEQLPGVGAKTSAAVLNFSYLRMPALVVDTHHLRVAQRTGLVGMKISLAKAALMLENYLPKGWTAQQLYDNHEAFMYHGQKCCFHSNPACERCPVLHLCPFGKERLGQTIERSKGEMEE